MRKSSSLSLSLLLATSTACGSGSQANLSTADSGTQARHPALKAMVFSDPHYFEPSLGTSGAAFEAYLATDRKLLAESDAILRALVGLVEAENPQVVLIPGDLTKDGELLSHTAVAGYLKRMMAGGRSVFVVPGNHDIQNGAATSYSGDAATPVATVSATQFVDIYGDMGYAQALARDSSSLSYVAELVPGLWLLALDSCKYGDAPGTSQISGQLVPSTRAWIQEQLEAARQRGIRVVAMLHHGLVEHFAYQAGVFSDFLIDDRDAVASLLSDGGVGLVFTGHFHANDVTQGRSSPSTRSIFDVETGSAITYPSPYRVVDLVDDTVSIRTGHVTSIDYDLGGATDFPTYSHDFLQLGLREYISGILQSPSFSMSAADAAEATPWLGDGLLAHYVGDEVSSTEVVAESQSLRASGKLVNGLAGLMLESIWTDLQPADNTLTLDLATR